MVGTGIGRGTLARSSAAVPAAEGGDQAGQLLGPQRVRPNDDRRTQQVEGQVGVSGRLLGDQVLQLGLLLGVEQPVGRADRPLLGHRRRVVVVKPVGRHRGGVDEALGAGGGRRSKSVEGAVDVNGTDRLPGCGPGDHEGEVDDDVGAVEGLRQRVGVPHVAPAVGHLRPVVRRRIERPAGHADDLFDAVVGLEQRHQPKAERAGRPGDRHGQPGLGRL